MYEFKYKVSKGQTIVTDEAYEMVLNQYMIGMKDSTPDNNIKNVLNLQNY